MADMNRIPSESSSGFSDNPVGTFKYDAPEHHLEADGIDSIKSFLLELWKGRWLIIVVSALSLALALIAFVFVPISKTASLNLRPIPSEEAEKYDQLNSVRGSVTVGEDALFSVTSGVLMSALMEDMFLRKTIVEAMRENKLLTIAPGETEEEFGNRLKQEAYRFDILTPQDTGSLRGEASRVIPSWTIRYAGKDEDKIRSVIFEALEASTSNVKSKLTQRFERLITKETLTKNQKIEDIDRAITLAVEGYNQRIAQRKVLLKEQAEIARKVGISNNTLEARVLDSNSKIVAINEQSGPLYYRGYNALEKELNLIESRENNLDFVPGLVDLNISKMKLQQNPTLERLRTAFSNSPLQTGEFNAAYYEKYAVKFKQGILKYLMPLLILFAGIFGVLAVIWLRWYLSVPTVSKQK